MEKPEKLKSIVIDSTKYRTTFSSKYIQKKKYIKKDDSHITAFIPGTIFKLFVKEGQKVKKGSRLLILEAMKMKNNLFCPFNAIVKKIHVNHGQIVPKDAVLIKLERTIFSISKQVAVCTALKIAL